MIIIHGTELLASVEATKGNASTAATVEAHEVTGQQTDSRILHQVTPSEKAYATVGAKLAILGHELRRREHPSGLKLFEVGRCGQWRIYSSWHDVLARLSALGG